MTGVSVSLPPEVERKRKGGSEVRASYHIDTIFSVRGVPVELNRRTFDEESAIFRSYDDLTREPTKLFTAFVMGSARVNPRRSSLGFALRLQVRVPEYDVDHRLWIDGHYEGGTLFSDKLNIEVVPEADGGSRIKYGWDSRTPNRSPSQLQINKQGEARIGEIAFASRSTAHPGIRGTLRLTVTSWNT